MGLLHCGRRSQQMVYRLADPAFAPIIAALKSIYCADAGTAPAEAPRDDLLN